jgi:hypothetical protein
VSPAARNDKGSNLSRRALLTRARRPFSSISKDSAASTSDATDEWVTYTSARCGTSIGHPMSWPVDARADVNLLYPHQSFVLRNAAEAVGSAGDLPDLNSYSPHGIFLWLLHYDDQGISAECQPFQPLESYDELEQRTSEFPGFRRYGSSFSGSQRSFVLRLWIGGSAFPRTTSVLNACLASINVP